MSKKVYVEARDRSTITMFEERGWDVVATVEDADVICFTGGSDVSPMLYENGAMKNTISDPKRDEFCANIFYSEDSKDALFVGICRGGQFLNVMCGGRLYQDVDGHATTHDIYCTSTGKIIEASSSHHQMMVPTEEGEVLYVAEKSLYKLPKYDDVEEKGLDVEVVWYEDDKCLCFQPHPEWVEKDHECQELFFDLIEEYL